jgi:hypothetical protein
VNREYRESRLTHFIDWVMGLVSIEGSESVKAQQIALLGWYGL